LISTVSVEAKISGNISLTSDYVSRGVSYSDNNPAVQGGLDFFHPTGFYSGIWGSNYDFDTDAQVEMDFYGGIAGPIVGGLGWDFGVAYYVFPEESGTNYGEVYGGLNYKAFASKFWYANDYGGTGGNETYLEVGLKLNLPHSVGLGLHGGYSDFDAETGIEGYMDYKANLFREFEEMNFDLSYTDTDWNQFGNRDDRRFIFTVSKNF
jgi:uncharacterized protein (TIGR02001 family)